MKTTIVLNLLIGLWLLIVGPGFVYAMRLKHRAKRARAWFRAQRLNGYREIVASGAIYRGTIRVFIFGDMVAMGALAAITQFFDPGSDARAVISAVFRLAFILMALAFSYKSYLEDHELDLLVSEDQKRTVRTRSTDQL